MQNTDENIRELKEVVRRETPRLLRLPRVLSVGVALKFRNGLPFETLCVRVTVKKKKSVEPANTNMQRIEDVVRVPGYPVDVIEIEDETEPSEPRVCDVSESEARTGTYDVLKGGHAIYTEQYGVKQPYGTLGMVVFDRWSCQSLILTSRDILRSLPLSDTGQKEHPQELFQGDGNEPVGKGLRGDFAYGESNGDLTLHSNFLVAEPTYNRSLSPEVKGIPFERVFLEPKLGMKVWKSGARSGVTQGIITQLNGFEFRVGNQTSASFSCFGDTGAIVFGEKDGKKRPVGMVTRFYEGNKEIKCISLRPALIANPWLDISLTCEGQSTTIHRFWSEEEKSTFDSSLISPILGKLYREFKYQGPIYEAVNEFDLDAIPLYGWYNPTLDDHFYSTEKNGEGKAGVGYIFNGQVGFVSKKKQENQLQLHRVVNRENNDHMMILRNQIADARASGYEFDLTSYEGVQVTSLPVASSRLSNTSGSKNAPLIYVGDVAVDNMENSYIKQRFPSPLIGSVDQDTANCVFTSKVMMLKHAGYLHKKATLNQVLRGLYHKEVKEIDGMSFVYGTLSKYRSEQGTPTAVTWPQLRWWGLEDSPMYGKWGEAMNFLDWDSKFFRIIYFLDNNGETKEFAKMMVDLSQRKIKGGFEAFYFAPLVRARSSNLARLLINLRWLERKKAKKDRIVLKTGYPRMPSSKVYLSAGLRLGELYMVSGYTTRPHFWLVFIVRKEKLTYTLLEMDPIGNVFLGWGREVDEITTKWAEYVVKNRITRMWTLK